MVDCSLCTLCDKMSSGIPEAASKSSSTLVVLFGFAARGKASLGDETRVLLEIGRSRVRWKAGDLSIVLLDASMSRRWNRRWRRRGEVILASLDPCPPSCPLPTPDPCTLDKIVCLEVHLADTHSGEMPKERRLPNRPPPLRRSLLANRPCSQLNNVRKPSPRPQLLIKPIRDRPKLRLIQVEPISSLSLASWTLRLASYPLLLPTVSFRS